MDSNGSHLLSSEHDSIDQGMLAVITSWEIAWFIRVALSIMLRSNAITYVSIDMIRLTRVQTDSADSGSQMINVLELVLDQAIA